MFYPCRPLDVAFLRGTTADAEGNVTMEREAATLDSLSIAQATRNLGGIVIVQVECVTTRHVLPPRDVRIPGIFVDHVVIARARRSHMQTFAESYNAAGRRRDGRRVSATGATALDARKVIARRAAMLLTSNAVVNLGIGIPEGIATVAEEEGILDVITLTDQLFKGPRATNRRRKAPSATPRVVRRFQAGEQQTHRVVAGSGPAGPVTGGQHSVDLRLRRICGIVASRRPAPAAPRARAGDRRGRGPRGNATATTGDKCSTRPIPRLCARSRAAEMC